MKSLFLAAISAVTIASCKHSSAVGSSSMEPALKASSVVTWKSLSPSAPLKRGDLVVIRSPLGSDGIWVRRVVGLPGETVELTSPAVVANSVPFDWKTLTSGSVTSYGSPQKPVFIPAGTYLLLGDNWTNSRDGREFGPTPLKDIVGIVTP